MTKTAIFVEGQTELIFIREYLLKMFEYQNVEVYCYKLIADSNFSSTPYPFPNENAQYYFEIINVGNDKSVLSKLLDREMNMWNRGFHKIYGIRDMYSDNYKESAPHHVIDKDIISDFIDGAKKTIEQRAIKPENIFFHYSIMETEAWILGIDECLIRLHKTLTHDNIFEHLKMDLKNTDPETTYFHPANDLKKIYKLAGSEYNKSDGDINAIMGYIGKDDFINLSKSGKCRSFKNIHDTLIPN